MYAPRTQGPWLPERKTEAPEPESIYEILFEWESDTQQYGTLQLFETLPNTRPSKVDQLRVYATQRDGRSTEEQYLAAYETLTELITKRTARAVAKKNLLDIARMGGHYG